MAHMVETMMYAGEVPWHGLGTYVGDEPIKSSDAIVKAGLDWKVKKWPLLAQNPDQVGELSKVSDYYAIVRETDSRILGVVGSRYVPLQNEEAFSFLDALSDEGQVRYHTAGSLRGGGLIWLLAEMPESQTIILPGDEVKSYLLFSNTHDGTGAIRVFWTNVRVVCNNTFQVALQEGKGQGLSIRHIGDLQSKIDQARSVLGLVSHQKQEFADAARHLARTNMTTDRWQEFLDTMVPLPPQREDAVRDGTGRARAIREELTELFESGIGSDIPGVRGTAWQAFNAITEYTTHRRGTRVKNESDRAYKRLESIWFGSSAEMTKKAFNTLLQAA